MELPAQLRAAVDRLLEGVPLTELQRAAQRLSARYRAETLDGTQHLNDRLAMQAYVATRLPATYAAVRAAMRSVAEADPDFAPATLIDFGAGPGTAMWAANECWSNLSRATLVEASAAARDVGQMLAADGALPHAQWVAGDISHESAFAEHADLVTLCYVLDELPEPRRANLIARLWSATSRTLLIVEPGTPAGWQRILEARRQLIDAGAHVIAPCPHAAPCPLTPPDWCHFSRRVARSRMHRLAKSGDVPWEDEKFAYIAVSRARPAYNASRVLAPPHIGKGHVTLKLCCPDGAVSQPTVSRRDGNAYKAAKRADWGDAVAVTPNR